MNRRAREIFDALVEQPAATRERLLDAACDGDVVLRSRVIGLLAADECTHSFLEVPAALTADVETNVAGMPERIGRYRIERVIASGGMGTVYEATQDNPRRTVAVKVMRHGLLSRSARRRFEYESQVLARLRHPGIAQIYEAGTHDDGGGTVPYFAMEFVEGAKPISRYADDCDLGTRARLELFVKVCDAVGHGHQKGIIHRDLKPGNILIDSDDRVKIIDFGVARSTDSDLAITTMHTGVGQLIGTLQYMSPEQCLADSDNIDVRSDVYALGVVLYELLCGKLPYDVSRLAVPAATRVICEQPPTPASEVDRTLRGDLDTILLKALEKDPRRRYASALELKQDLRRYLEGEAILARAPSVAYQLRVLVRRNKALFGAIAALVAVLAFGTILSTTLYLGSERARKRATAQRDRAEAQQRFMTDVLASLDSAVKRQEEVSVLSLLGEAALRIEDRAASVDPKIKANWLTTIGKTYEEIGYYDKAIPHLRDAWSIRRHEFGEQHEEVAASLHNLARALHRNDDRTEAEERYREALTMRRQLLAEAHPDLVETLHGLAEFLREGDRGADARPLIDEAVEIARDSFGAGHPTLATVLNEWADLRLKDDPATAEPYCLEALQIRRTVLGESPEVAASLNVLAIILGRQGRYAEAEDTHQEALLTRRRVLGDDHPLVGQSLQNYASDLSRLGRAEEAERLARESVKIREEAISGHWRVGVSRAVLAGCLQRMGRFEEAEREALGAYNVLQASLGDDHHRTLSTIRQLMLLYESWKKHEEALTWAQEGERVLRSVIEDQAAKNGLTGSGISLSYARLAFCLIIQGRHEEAEEALQEAERASTDSVLGRRELAILCGTVLRNSDEAARWLPVYEERLREDVQSRMDERGQEHVDVAYARMRLAECLIARGRFADAEGELLEAHRVLTILQDERPWGFRESMAQLAELYESWDKPDEATRWRGRASR